MPPIQPTSERHFYEESIPGYFPLADETSDIVLHTLTKCNLGPQDLARLEATCLFFRVPAKLFPDNKLSIAEVAALDMCKQRAMFKSMKSEEQQELKKRCDGSWKNVLRFLLAGEACMRRGKSQALAGPGHSIVVTSKGVVYSFGSNRSGQLGHGDTVDEWRPRPIRSLQGIRIVQAAVGKGKTMLISDAGHVYACGKDLFGESENQEADQESSFVSTPRIIESLKSIFVVQATIGKLVVAALSREGKVYIFTWGNKAKLGHETDLKDFEPRLLLEHVPVVQIAAGYCYLLALACEPSGMSIYSVGCGLGGKLGHGSTTYEKEPRLIKEFQILGFEPVMIAAGAWHAAAVGKDGRVFTWGWGNFGCLGHGNALVQNVPKVVEGLSSVKAVHVSAGEYTTFVVSHDGLLYSFGCEDHSNLGHGTIDFMGEMDEFMVGPKLVQSLWKEKERVVQISPSNAKNCGAHTLALTESGKVYAFGIGDNGQLGVQLDADQATRWEPQRVAIDLN